jgi:hypothetical protein
VRLTTPRRFSYPPWILITPGGKAGNLMGRVVLEMKREGEA